jgi:hypothetical protein
MKGACLDWMLFANKQEQEFDMDSHTIACPLFKFLEWENKILKMTNLMFIYRTISEVWRRGRSFYVLENKFKI